jgi:hypothetical protein
MAVYGGQEHTDGPCPSRPFHPHPQRRASILRSSVRSTPLPPEAREQGSFREGGKWDVILRCLPRPLFPSLLTLYPGPLVLFTRFPLYCPPFF